MESIEQSMLRSLASLVELHLTAAELYEALPPVPVSIIWQENYSALKEELYVMSLYSRSTDESKQLAQEHLQAMVDLLKEWSPATTYRFERATPELVISYQGTVEDMDTDHVISGETSLEVFVEGYGMSASVGIASYSPTFEHASCFKHMPVLAEMMVTSMLTIKNDYSAEESLDMTDVHVTLYWDKERLSNFDFVFIAS